MIFPEFSELVQLKHQVTRLKLPKTDANLAAAGGQYISLFQGQGMEFETVRNYVFGDEVRHIDWQVTARTGKPHIKTFRAECDRKVILCVDMNAYMRFGTKGTFKSIQAAKVASIIAWQALKDQERVGGIVFGDNSKGIQTFLPTRTRAATWQLLKVLCTKEIDQHDIVSLDELLNHLLKVKFHNALICIISDFSTFTKETENKLSALKAKNQCLTISIFDPADRDLPNLGIIECEAFREVGLIINSNDKQARENYRRLWEEQEQTLNQTLRKLNIPRLSIATNDEVVRALCQGKLKRG